MSGSTDCTSTDPASTDRTSTDRTSTDPASTDRTASVGGSPVPHGGSGVVVPFPVRRDHVATVGDGEAFTIDCADCAHRCTDVCDDCVVSFVVGREPEDALVVDADEARAVRLLERAGLVPGVRHEVRAGGA